MLKTHDPVAETAEQRARRKWGNNSVRVKFLEQKREAREVALAEKREPIIAETLKNTGRKDGSINRLESKFKKELKAMLRGHSDHTLALYAAWVRHRKRQLLLEKLRRAEARRPETTPKRDLFA
jgi:hypothetical protein